MKCKTCEREYADIICHECGGVIVDSDRTLLEEAVSWIVDNMTCDIPKDELERANRIIERAEGSRTV